MKKSALLLFLVMVLCTTIQAQVAWVTQKIDENLSIKFPGEAKKTTVNGTDSYLYEGKDSVMYSAVILDYKVMMHLDSAGLAPMKDTKRFADGMREGIASKKTNYTFGDITMGKWNTYSTYSMFGTDKNNKNKISIRMILISSKMYIFSCRVPAELTTQNNEYFFDSLELLKAK